MIKNYFSLLVGIMLTCYQSTNAQYCVTNLGGAGCGTDQITDVEIVGTTLVNTANTCTGTFANTLTVFPASGNTTATLTQGNTYAINITTTANNIISVWIDYDNNQVYDASEWVQVCLTSVAGNVNSAALTIPFGAFTGSTGMRIRSRANGNNNGATDACTNFGSGEAEDYTVTIAAGSPCVAPPTAGTTFSPAASACLSTSITLSLNGNSIGSGQTYQWQSSPDNITWSDIIGATNSFYVDSVTAAMYFQCIVTCSAQSATSTPFFIGVNPANQCYCASFSNSSLDDDIGNVTLASLNNGIGSPALANPTSVNTYTDFTSLPPTDLLQGLIYPISITQINSGTFYSCFATVHIDFNQDGVFDTTEVSAIGQTNNAIGANVLNGNISIPLTALSGNTRMRIVLRENGSATQSACGSYGYGETEDYIVNILSATPCIAPPTAGITLASAILVCDSSSINLSLSGNSIGIGQTYQWQSSPDNVTWTNIAGATNQNATVPVIGATSFRCEVTCSGNAVNSTPISIALKPFYQCYCASYPTSAADDDLGWFEFGSLLISGDTSALNNPTSNKTYTDYTVFGAFSYSQGASYPIKAVQINSSANFYICILKVYLDYNQDGLYDSTEVVFTDTTNNAAGGNLMQGLVTIPVNAPIGNTGLRAVLSETMNSFGPCGTYGYGETEDYIAYIDYPLSVKSISQNLSLSAIPNPASDKLTLSFINHEPENTQIKLFNLNGQLVFAESLNHFSGKFSKTIDVSAFSKGIYNLQLISTNSITNKKVVIK